MNYAQSIINNFEKVEDTNETPKDFLVKLLILSIQAKIHTTFSLSQ